MRILLLEDDYLYQVSIKEFLEDMGFDVDAFDNGDDAFNSLFEKYYDLLLLDVRVPGMNGFEVVENLRKQEYYDSCDNPNLPDRYKQPEPGI